MALVDELRAEQTQRHTRCRLCLWLSEQSDEDKQEWIEALEDRSYSHRALHRALERRKADVVLGSVEHHRREGHGVS